MAVIKLTSSGKAMQFIDDLGCVHQIACSYLLGYITKRGNVDYIPLTKLPLKVSTDRYKGMHKLNENDFADVEVKFDAHSTKSKKEQKQKSVYQDKKVF